MTEKVILVSAPDDILEDACRILTVDLTAQQNEIISQCLLSKSSIPKTVIYTWNSIDENTWIFDKILKSDLIIFNAESENQTLVGYLAARRNAFYFGHLKTLSIINKSAIYDVQQCSELLERTFDTYGKT